ncbi:MAG: Unknown, probable insecticidal toxin [uncultured Paraburkholderia sp.]|nr:MAG: Unknown, probable insecticidal toxin [uncultured Paraburkholderia sp.]
MFHRLQVLAGQEQPNEAPALVSRLVLEYDLNARVSLLLSACTLAHENDGTSVRQPPLELDYQRVDNPVSHIWQEAPQLDKLNIFQPWQLVYAFYQQNISASEERAMDMKIEAQSVMASSTGVMIAAGVAKLLPNIFGLADGGMRFEDAVEALAHGLFVTGQGLGIESDLLAMSETYRRRREEWQIQYEQAQTQAMLSFMQNRFTRSSLYQWLSGQLAALYTRSMTKWCRSVWRRRPAGNMKSVILPPRSSRPARGTTIIAACRLGRH